MLQQQNNGGNWELGSKSTQEIGAELGLFDVFEARGDGQQNLDGVLLGCGVVARAAVEPRRESENDDNKRIAQHAKEEEKAC